MYFVLFFYRWVIRADWSGPMLVAWILYAEHHLEFLRLKWGCTGSSESTLVKMQHCWKSQIGTASANSAKFLGIRRRMYMRVYFDNACDNVTLSLYNVTPTLQKPCWQNNKCDCRKTNGWNEVYVFSIKYRYSDILLKKRKLHLFCRFNFSDNHNNRF